MGGETPQQRRGPRLSPQERDRLLHEAEACYRQADEAQQAGQYQQLIEKLERGLFVKRQLHEESSEEVAEACHRLCEACNFVAPQLLEKEDVKGTQYLLKRAEEVAGKNEQDLALTWNNLASYCRRMGKLKTAVSYLEQALAVETGSAGVANTHLNMCAVLSLLKRHVDALRHANSAMICIYENLTPLIMSEESAEQGDANKDKRIETITVLCIAYHNLAVEHEYLKNYENAVGAYVEGLRWSLKFLGKGNKLTTVLKDGLEAVKGNVHSGAVVMRKLEEIDAWFKI